VVVDDVQCPDAATIGKSVAYKIHRPPVVAMI